MPEHVDDAAPSYLALEPGKELLARRGIALEVEGGDERRLRRSEESSELREINCPCAIVILRIAEEPVMEADIGLGLVVEFGTGEIRYEDWPTTEEVIERGTDISEAAIRYLVAVSHY
jgi:hypothetical protein